MLQCNCCPEGSESGCGYYDGGEWVVETSEEQAADSAESTAESTSGGSRSVGGASAKSNWLLYVVGAAAVALVGAAIVMRKRVC